MNWNPIKTSCDRTEIILDHIRQSISTHDRKSLSLMGSTGGKVLYLSTESDPDTRTKITLVIEEMFAIAEESEIYSIGAGLIGFGWLVDYLTEEKKIDPIELFDEDLEQQLAAIAFQDLKAGFHDYIHGGLGFSFYLSAKKTLVPYQITLIENTIDLLDKQAKKDAFQVWPAFNARVGEISGYDMGTAHGVPSIIALLFRFYTHGIYPEKCLSLIHGAFDFLLGIMSNKESRLAFLPPFYPKEGTDINDLYGEYSRLAWCYGDLGVGVTLYPIAQKIGHSKMTEGLMKMLINCASRRALKENEIFDSSLCHGTAGACHLFNRIYQYTQNELFKETAVYWYDKTLDMICPPIENAPIFELFDYVNESGESQYSQMNLSFLEGMTGIGLVLKAATSYEEPTWDKLLLLS